MPIQPTTFFFADYFNSANPLDNYDPAWLYPPTIMPWTNHSHRVVRGGGPGGGSEGCWEFLPPTSYCQGCDEVFDECGEPGSICDFGSALTRFRSDPGSDWFHVRAWIKLEGTIEALDGWPPVSELGNWWFDQSWEGPGGWGQTLYGAIAMLMPKEENYVGSGAHPGPYGPSGELLSYRPAVQLVIGGFYLNAEPQVRIWVPDGIYSVSPPAFPDNGAGRPWPLHLQDWHCVEMAVGEIDAGASTGRVRLWVDGVESADITYQSTYGAGLDAPIGFACGSLSQYGGLGVPGPPYPWLGSLLAHAGLQERHPDRRWGLRASWARIATADGPIGCHTVVEPPPEESPDPDAQRCTSADDYASADALKGECGRAICSTKGKTRESWETAGAGFASEKSFWYSWTAPRDGNFIFRTRGSEVFNEISVHRHTGSTPPPLLASSDDDDWDPTSTTSAAVEILAEEGVEYRIRIASAFDGWIILDYGPARHLLQDDGWSIDESERETRERVSVAGLVSGLAVQDDQVAASSTGAGTAPTMEPVLFGEIT